ncbi:hypothetical protein IWQ62_000854 [Dispira parvispora]|uniref:[Histone H3]-trimethyl-L-lysine(9) demethylase n=1 Tax=Dispira parvispora TaxID=1520584 RepID=A0A9W8E8T0_9FUNG|nr:hypothetical protein IWQ62_000854 [Dispira parvispora]
MISTAAIPVAERNFPPNSQEIPTFTDEEILYGSPVDNAQLSAAIDAALTTLSPDHYYHGVVGVPVFKPTLLQFREFSRFIAAVEPYARKAGICKVIPPPVWRRALEAHVHQSKGVPETQMPHSLDTTPQPSEDNFPAELTPGQTIHLNDAEFPIMRPLVQHFEGSKGTYQQYNVENRRKMKLSQFFATCQSSRYATPTQSVSQKAQTPISPPQSVRLKDIKAPKSSSSVASAESVTKIENSGIYVDLLQGVTRSADPQHPACLSWYGINKPPPYSTDHTEKDKRAPSENPELVAYFDMLDRIYWRNLAFTPPMYGADVPGTLFPTVSDFPTWNPRDLGSVLNRIDVPMPGVNQPYLYMGMWKSTFAWHVEDMDLYSINYLHFGQPKSWYCIPLEYRARFERVAQSLFSEEAHRCSEFLRHKAFVVSPTVLSKQYDVPVYRLVQTQGEFVITFPGGYHAGFNQGFNCAESVNFALPSWAQLGKLAEPCKCIGDSVRIAVDKFFPSDMDEEDYWAEHRSGRFERFWERYTPQAMDPEDTLPLHRTRKRSSDNSNLPVAKIMRSPRSSHQSSVEELMSIADAVEKQYQDSPESPYQTYLIPRGQCGVCCQAVDESSLQDTPSELAKLHRCVDCDLVVHSECYRFTPPESIPWKCLRCWLGVKEMRCTLCPVVNGPLYLVDPLETMRKLKRIRRHKYHWGFLKELSSIPIAERVAYLRFAHPQCATLVPETSVTTTDCILSDVSIRDIYAVALDNAAVYSSTISQKSSRFPLEGALVQGYETVPKARWALKCHQCKTRQGGAIQCAEQRCCTPFHVSCLLVAQQVGTNDNESPSAVSTLPRLDLVEGKAYCKKHLPANP